MPAAVSLFYDDAQILVKIIINREREREREAGIVSLSTFKKEITNQKKYYVC